MNSAPLDAWIRSAEENGFVLLPRVLSPEEAADAARDVTVALRQAVERGALLSQEGNLYAARNVLTVWPRAVALARSPRLVEVLTRLLGESFGLVRGLYFDKPPGQSWALGWHKDMTVAVADNRLPSARFVKPTAKAGVPHVEAPLDVLERMLTARIHLDDVTPENGPLQVLPGSHRTGKVLKLGEAEPRTIFANAGDVLLMRPLLAHASGRSHDGTTRHRRILHLEFAADAHLADGYAWHTFERPTRERP